MKNQWRKKQISILGLGLIGGSLAMALKEKKCTNIIGTSSSKKTMQVASKLGIIDTVATSVEEAVRNSDLVVVCTPISAIESIFARIAPHLREGCIVTDVASTKATVIELAEKTLPDTVSFIGGHPMAGKEKSGIEYAERDLFKHCTWCLIPSSTSNKDSLLQLKELVFLLGARPIVMDAETHDKAVASISHLPFLLSIMLVNTVSTRSSWRTAAALVASGFKDVSRLASGKVSMHADICETNRSKIIKILDEFLDTAHKLRHILQSDNHEKLVNLMIEAKRQRDKLYAKDIS